LEGSSVLEAQHFSILRELKTYCLQLKDLIKYKKNVMQIEDVVEGLEELNNLVEAGCEFLNYPVII
jgi:hypothetical protein